MIPDPKNEMVIGYNAAADRIEIQIGKPSGVALDIGCNDGSGMQSLSARWQDAHLYGLEPESNYAAMARGKGFVVFCESAQSTGYVGESVDFIFSRHSLEHVPEPAKAIAEFHRILRPGGRAYFQIPIEPDGSPNDLHVSAFRTHAAVVALFAQNLWKTLYWGPQETVVEIIVEKLFGQNRQAAVAEQYSDRPAACVSSGTAAQCPCPLSGQGKGVENV